MRRKAKAELGTLSVSALDLFASALGAFIVITLLLFPYFPNTDDYPPIIERLERENAALAQALEEKIDANAKISADLAVELAGLEDQLDGSAFVGIEPRQDTENFQLLVDLSGSIVDYREEAFRITKVVLERLGDNNSLLIYTFQGDSANPVIRQWPEQGAQLGMTEAARRKALRFVEAGLLSAAGNTPTFEALEIAIAPPPNHHFDNSTIIILTDGLPTAGESLMSRYEIALRTQKITRMNSGGNTRRHDINIIAIGDFVVSDTATAMIPLATENGGALVALPETGLR